MNITCAISSFRDVISLVNASLNGTNIWIENCLIGELLAILYSQVSLINLQAADLQGRLFESKDSTVNISNSKLVRVNSKLPLMTVTNTVFTMSQTVLSQVKIATVTAKLLQGRTIMQNCVYEDIKTMGSPGWQLFENTLFVFNSSFRNFDLVHFKEVSPILQFQILYFRI
jgi:hypothetical protein